MNFSVNVSANFSESILLFHQTHVTLMRIYLAIGLAICMCGVVSNVVCLLAIFIHPRLYNPRNILVGNFIFVNLTLSAIVYPCSILSVYLHAYPEVIFPATFCQWIFFYYFTIHALCWQECMLAYNRFVAIVLPFHYRKISSPKALLGTAAVGYLVPIVLNICAASLGKQDLFTSESPFGGCLPNSKGDKNLQVLHSAIGVYLPMTMVGAMYLTILVKVCVNRLTMGPMIAGSYKRRLAVTRMLSAGFLWFCVTYLPQPVMTTFFKDSYDRNPWSYVGSRWALFLGAGASALVYAATNKDYRHGMSYVLFHRCGRIDVRTKRSANSDDLIGPATAMGTVINMDR